MAKGGSKTERIASKIKVSSVSPFRKSFNDFLSFIRASLFCILCSLYERLFHSLLASSFELLAVAVVVVVETAVTEKRGAVRKQTKLNTNKICFIFLFLIINLISKNLSEINEISQIYNSHPQ